MTRNYWYSPEGIPITAEQWEAEWNNHQSVAQTEVLNGDNPKQQYTVSTVYLGIDHGFGNGPPLIFETMVFGNDLLEEDTYRYSTRQEAIQGHVKMVATVASTLDNPIVMEVDKEVDDDA